MMNKSLLLVLFVISCFATSTLQEVKEANPEQFFKSVENLIGGNSAHIVKNVLSFASVGSKNFLTAHVDNKLENLKVHNETTLKLVFRAIADRERAISDTLSESVDRSRDIAEFASTLYMDQYKKMKELDEMHTREGYTTMDDADVTKEKGEEFILQAVNRGAKATKLALANGMKHIERINKDILIKLQETLIESQQMIQRESKYSNKKIDRVLIAGVDGVDRVTIQKLDLESRPKEGSKEDRDTVESVGKQALMLLQDEYDIVRDKVDHVYNKGVVQILKAREDALSQVEEHYLNAVNDIKFATNNALELTHNTQVFAWHTMDPTTQQIIKDRH